MNIYIISPSERPNAKIRNVRIDTFDPTILQNLTNTPINTLKKIFNYTNIEHLCHLNKKFISKTKADRDTDVNFTIGTMYITVGHKKSTFYSYDNIEEFISSRKKDDLTYCVSPIDKKLKFCYKDDQNNIIMVNPEIFNLLFKYLSVKDEKTINIDIADKNIIIQYFNDNSNDLENYLLHAKARLEFWFNSKVELIYNIFQKEYELFNLQNFNTTKLKSSKKLKI